MTRIEPEPEEEQERGEEKAGEVPTSFATKGVGWSGREEQDESDPPA